MPKTSVTLPQDLYDGIGDDVDYPAENMSDWVRAACRLRLAIPVPETIPDVGVDPKTGRHDPTELGAWVTEAIQLRLELENAEELIEEV